MPQQFQHSEAEQILQEAVKRDSERRSATFGASVLPSGVSEERLRAMADELGIAPDVLEAVLNEREAKQIQEQAALRRDLLEGDLRREFITERRAGFSAHLYAYVGVNIFLILLFGLLHATVSPVLLSLLGWGLGLYFHATTTLPTRGPVFEKRFATWREKRTEQETKRAKKQAKEREQQSRKQAEAELDGL
jgi:hypothetical protein